MTSVIYLLCDQTYKPSSVLSSHQSRFIVTNKFKRPTTGNDEQPLIFSPIWSCSRWGLHSHIVAYMLVSSYLTVPSLPFLAVYFCCTFLKVASTGYYPAPCSMELGLSSCLSTRLPGLLTHFILYYIIYKNKFIYF